MRRSGAHWQLLVLLCTLAAVARWLGGPARHVDRRFVKVLWAITATAPAPAPVSAPPRWPSSDVHRPRQIWPTTLSRWAGRVGLAIHQPQAESAVCSPHSSCALPSCSARPGGQASKHAGRRATKAAWSISFLSFGYGPWHRADGVPRPPLPSRALDALFSRRLQRQPLCWAPFFAAALGWVALLALLELCWRWAGGRPLTHRRYRSHYYHHHHHNDHHDHGQPHRLPSDGGARAVLGFLDA